MSQNQIFFNKPDGLRGVVFLCYQLVCRLLDVFNSVPVGIKLCLEVLVLLNLGLQVCWVLGQQTNLSN